MIKIFHLTGLTTPSKICLIYLIGLQKEPGGLPSYANLCVLVKKHLGEEARELLSISFAELEKKGFIVGNPKSYRLELKNIDTHKSPGSFIRGSKSANPVLTLLNACKASQTPARAFKSLPEARDYPTARALIQKYTLNSVLDSLEGFFSERKNSPKVLNLEDLCVYLKFRN